MEIALVLAVVALVFIYRTFKIVPQQNAWVVERLGRYDRTLTPGLKFVIPFVDRVAYKHSLKEVPVDVPSVPLGTQQRHHLLMAVKEACNNVVRHSGASEVWVRFQTVHGGFWLTVEDNGRGFHST